MKQADAFMKTLFKQVLHKIIYLHDFIKNSRRENSGQSTRKRCFAVIICMAFAGSTLTACSPAPPDTHSNSEPQSDIADVSEVMSYSNPDEQHFQMRRRWFDAFNAYTADDSAHAELRHLYAQDLITVGRTDIPFQDGIITPSQSICVRNPDNNGRNAGETLLSLIGDHNVIIINEDHSMPRDRAFILDLLPALRSRGFTHYAAETFHAQARENVSPFIVVGDGHYTDEPIFGRLATKAKTLGYRLVPYEMTMEQMLADKGLTLKDVLADSEITMQEALTDNSSVAEQIEKREIAQSENLIKNVWGESPDTKIIVHVGFSHASEIPEGGHRWMAARLKDKTGIDPLTISQTHCRSDGTDAYVATDAVNTEGEPHTPFTDLLIAHPPLTFEKHRPAWRRGFGDKEVEIPPQFLGHSEPILIEARTPDQPGNAVPIERLLLRPGEQEIPLLLPTGIYRIEAFNSDGNISGMKQIEVK